jgi:hypothetical protein
MIGTVVGNYRIVRELGQGGMGAVYEGIDVMVERPVAIKMLRAEIARNPDVIERFRVEAVTLARLNHPCIATLYSFFREGEHYYMVMEFVRGDTMENLIQRSGRLAPEYAAEILAQTLDGMAHAQAMGVLHRDIKPANIMITHEGRVKVTDFGIARLLGSSRMTRDGRIIGTLEYLAPERIRGEDADIRSDLYSAGVVFYETISGRLPFTADTDYDLMQAHLNQPAPPLQSQGLNYPPWVDSILSRALAKSREDRFQSAEEFRDTLTAAIGHPGVRSGITAASPVQAMKPTRLAPPSITATAPESTAPAPARLTLPMKWIGLAAGALVVLAGLFLIAPSRRAVQEETPQVAALLTQPAQEIQLPPADVEPQKPAAPVDTGRTLPLEMFQSKPPQALRDKPVKSIPINKEGRTGGMKDLQLPGKINKTDPSPVSDTEHKPAEVEEPVPPPKAETAASVPASNQVMTLREVRRIFVEKMPDQLDEYVKSEIDKQLFGRVRLASRRENADAVLQGVTDEDTGSAILTDLKGSVVLWKDEAGDESSLLGITKRGGPKKIAERLVNSLKEKMDY